MKFARSNFGFSLAEMMATLVAVSIVGAGLASLSTWGAKEYRAAQGRSAFRDSVFEAKNALRSKTVCTENLTRPAKMVYDPASTTGLDVARIDSFDPAKNYIRTILAKGGAGAEGFAITDMKLLPKGKLGADKYQADLVISSAIRAGDSSMVQQNQSIALMITLESDGSNEIKDCVSLAQDGEIDMQFVCAASSQTYDSTTNSCVAPIDIRVEGYGTTISCPDNYRSKWGGGCLADGGEDPGFAYEMRDYVAPDGRVLRHRVPNQHPYTTSMTPDLKTCTITYAANVPNPSLWYIWMYCEPI